MLFFKSNSPFSNVMFLIFRNTVADGEAVQLDFSKKDANSNSDNKDSIIEVLFIYFHSLVS